MGTVGKRSAIEAKGPIVGAGSVGIAATVEATCTELILTESEAVPEMLMEPETVAPLAGEVIATEGAGATTLMLKFWKRIVPQRLSPARRRRRSRRAREYGDGALAST